MIHVYAYRLVRPAAVLLTLLIATSCLTACWDRNEINDLAIVTAAGFDLADDNKIKLSVQIYVPASSSSGQSLGSQPSGEIKQAFVESAIGANTSEAASRLQELLSRRLFWGQSDVFIFSEKLAKHGLNDPLDFLIRHPDPRERANIYISKGNADKLLAWKSNIERNSAEALREMSVIQTGLDVSLLEAIVDLSDEAHTTLIPWVRMKKSGNKTSPYFGGIGSIKAQKLNYLYDIYQARGLLWLHDQIEIATLTTKIEDSNGYASMEIVSGDTNLKPIVQGDKLAVSVQIKIAGNINENTTKLDVTKPENVKMLEKQFSLEIMERIEGAVKIAQQTNTDVLGFADQFHRHHPQVWKKNKPDWDHVFPQVEVKYDIDVTILRIGLVGKNKVLNDGMEQSQ
ncbi:Ger(x)C family spore germination protein [Paenibacillus sp. 2TAB19]|uniref:Ger(x)C family spore germination protein n=1 Tax=Paenibacillus sp. 2TAB19 TaxID=3233003 RepID=UPI003F9998D4